MMENMNDNLYDEKKLSEKNILKLREIMKEKENLMKTIERIKESNDCIDKFADQLMKVFDQLEQLEALMNEVSDATV